MRVVLRILLYLVLVAIVGLVGVAIFSDLPAPRARRRAPRRGEVSARRAPLVLLGALALAAGPALAPAARRRAAQRHPLALAEHRGHPAAAEPAAGGRPGPARRDDHRAAPARAQPRRHRPARPGRDRLRRRRCGVRTTPPRRRRWFSTTATTASRRRARSSTACFSPTPSRPRAPAPPRRCSSPASTACSRPATSTHADALIARAGPDTPDLFRRWFDIGLLLDRAGPPCTALRQNPSLSPTLPARVFCLARTGDWNAAEITLTLGEQVGSIDADQQALLARFLDPVIFEGEPEPPAPEPLTPLDFLMREAVGLDRPPGQLPLAFLHADLDEHVPMRARVDAAERLTVSGAIEPGVLFDAYRSGVPAASGGVWDRAAAVQALDAVLAGPPPAGGNGLADALAAADAALADRGLRVAFAEAYAPALAALDPAALPPEARARLSELLLLAGDVAGARHAAGAEPDARTAALLALADGAGPAAEAAAAPDDPRLAAAIAGLAASEPADERERGLAADVASGRQGRAIVAALDLLVPGGAVDPPSLRAAILTLRLAGQDDAARTIAIETLLAGQPG